MQRELGAALDDFEDDVNIGAVVITGDEKAFAGLLLLLLVGGRPDASVRLTAKPFNTAGADIKEMHEKKFIDVYYVSIFFAFPFHPLIHFLVLFSLFFVFLSP